MQDITLGHVVPSPSPLERIISAGIIDLAFLPCEKTLNNEELDDEIHLQREAARSQLARLNGRSIAGLSDNQRQLVAKSLQVLLALEEAPDISTGDDAESDLANQALLYERGGESLLRLESLRRGQPDPELMLALSPEAKECLEYVRVCFRERHPFVRLIAGEMGQGKTTLARAIQEVAHEEQATPILLTIPRSTKFDPAGWLRDMVLDQKLLTVTFREIAATALLMGDQRQASLCDCWRTAPLSLVMITAIRHVFSNPAHYVTLGNARQLARACESALTPWFSSTASRVTPAQKFLSRYGGEGWFTGGFDAKRLAPALLTDFLCFYREAGCYPVWLFDEFESVAGVRNESRQIALGFFRDVVDAVSAEHGAVFLFSTGDGRAAIRGYPALEDRLKVPEGKSNLYSPTWFASDFAQWSPESVVEELLEIYASAAHRGNPLAQSVTEHTDQIREIIKEPAIHQILADHDAIPRERLKGIIALLDQIHTDGMEHFETLIQEANQIELNRAYCIPEDSEDSEDLQNALEDLQDTLNEYMTDPPPRSGPQSDIENSYDEHDLLEPANLLTPGSSQQDDGPEQDVCEWSNATLVEDAHSKHSTLSTEPALPFGEKPRLNPYGLQRWELRSMLQAAEMPFVKKASCHLEGVKPTREQLVQSSNHAYLGLRLSILRDLGCGIAEEWQAAVADTYLELSGEDRVRLASSSADTQKLEESSKKLLAMIDRNHGSVPVAMPATPREAAERAKLAKEDRAAIKAMKKAGGNPYPFVPYNWPWPGCSVLGIIVPLDNVQVFRQVVYTWFAMDTGLVPVDEWVDQFVLETMAKRFGYQPRSSRDGVEFIVTKSRLLGMFDKRRRISTESVADLSQAHCV